MDEHDHHGHSVAAWTAVITLLVAASVMSAAVAFPNVVLFVVGAVIAVVGVVAGKVLAMAGYGVEGKSGSPGSGDSA